LRIGWDLLLDIDSQYIEYSKIYAKIIIDFLEFSGVKNVGIKFSGSKGFHLIIPWKAFPEEINGVKTSDMFPNGRG
jgi:DNA primase catalytic subunit